MERASFTARVVGRRVELTRQGTARDHKRELVYVLRPNALASAVEAAAILGVTRQAVYAWLRGEPEVLSGRLRLQVRNLLAVRRARELRGTRHLRPQP